MTAPTFEQQLQALGNAYAAIQTQLTAALANDAADKAASVALQQQVADLQAQLRAVQPGKAPAPPAGYVVALQDDFNGAIGPAWTVLDGTGANNELSLRLARNVQATPDHLTITAKRESVGARQFTSGYLTTAGKASWPYGRFLVRARCSDLFGLWPAPGWLRFDTAVGEIDGAELIGTVRKVVQSVHQSNQGTGDHSGYDWPMPAGWSMADWHVYGVERQKDGTIVWTIDGVETFRKAPTDLSTQMHQPMSWLTGPEFASSMHLIVNLQVGGSMPKSYLGAAYDQAKILPAGTAGALDIDWVQVLVPTA